MYFPIADVTVDPFLLMGVGFLVGILGGFFGVGGGFLAGPLMFCTGVPMNFVVGTDLAHMTGKSIVAARRHRALGHVDFKLGGFLVAGTIVGVEMGARIIEALQASGNLDLTIGLAYILILVGISLFTAWKSIQAVQMVRTDQIDVNQAVSFAGLVKRIRRLNLPPHVSFPVSGIESISIWIVLGVGLATGLLAGSLGVGGGFIRMPMLVYVLGVPTHVAVGTDLFEIVFSSGFGTVTHALKGNVDILIALVMHAGAAIGAQIGDTAPRFFSGPRIRLAFSFLPLLGAALVALRLLGAGVAH